jgi:hypothetical protein
LRAGLGETYVGDVIRRDRGKFDVVEKIVRANAPEYVDWVLKGTGHPLELQTARPRTFGQSRQQAVQDHHTTFARAEGPISRAGTTQSPIRSISILTRRTATPSRGS